MDKIWGKAAKSVQRISRSKSKASERSRSKSKRSKSRKSSRRRRSQDKASAASQNTSKKQDEERYSGDENGDQGETLAPDQELTEMELLDAVKEHAAFLGMDPDVDQEFFWIAKEALTCSLPEHWFQEQDEQGNVYYYNESTGESRWDHPRDDEFRALFKKHKDLKTGSTIQNSEEIAENVPNEADTTVSISYRKEDRDYNEVLVSESKKIEEAAQSEQENLFTNFHNEQDSQIPQEVQNTAYTAVSMSGDNLGRKQSVKSAWGGSEQLETEVLAETKPVRNFSLQKSAIQKQDSYSRPQYADNGQVLSNEVVVTASHDVRALESLKKELALLKELLEKKDMEHKEQLSVYEQDYGDLEVENQELQKEISELKRTIKIKNAEKDEEIDNLRAEVEVMEKQARKRCQSCVTREHELKNKTDEINHLSMELSRMREMEASGGNGESEEIAIAKKETELIRTSLADSEDRIKHLEQQVSDFKSIAEDKSLLVESLQEKISKLQREAEELAGRVSEMKMIKLENDDIKSSIVKCNADTKCLRMEVEMLSSRLDERKSELEACRNECVNLRKQYFSERESHETTKGDISKLGADIRSLEQVRLELSTSCDSLRKQLNSAAMAAQDADKKWIKQREETISVRKELEGVKARIESLTLENEYLKSTATELTHTRSWVDKSVVEKTKLIKENRRLKQQAKLFEMRKPREIPLSLAQLESTSESSDSEESLDFTAKERTETGRSYQRRALHSNAPAFERSRMKEEQDLDTLREKIKRLKKQCLELNTPDRRTSKYRKSPIYS